MILEIVLIFIEQELVIFIMWVEHGQIIDLISVGLGLTRKLEATLGKRLTKLPLIMVSNVRLIYHLLLGDT